MIAPRTAPPPRVAPRPSAVRRAPLALTAVVAATVLAACVDPRPVGREQAVPLGDPAHGRDLIRAYGCTSCHVVPGVRAPQGSSGPPLRAWSRRAFVAGEVANTPDALVRFIVHPQSVRPGSAMPELGVSEEHARHMAAYLYRLR